MRKIIVATMFAFALSASPAVAAKKEKMTPMELQSIQSREFEVEKPAAFAAVMTVIQDLGYIVDSADLASGFITANSPNENKTNFFGALAGVSASGNTVMTAFLMQMPNGMTRIRLNFVNSKTSSSVYGRTNRKDKPILDPAIYNNAWERIDESLFVMGALDATAPETPETKPASEDNEPSAAEVTEIVSPDAAETETDTDKGAEAEVSVESAT